ncbi:MAG: helix-turn-helix domain-containing protein [Flavobacteriales bacterium]|nr:helix-turn-helix domain-containing protein [Flavobacteriales bacterium]
MALFMEIREDDIRLILGLKLRRLRQEQGFSLAELGKLTGLSVSYLNEIEKGRKYPKAEKLAALAKALGTTFDKLVSLKLDKHLAPVGELLASGFLQDVPLDLFGIDRGKLVELIANAPAKVSAFISTLARIAATYNMTQEHFYFAALRSYQELYENHFEDLELEAKRFRLGLATDERTHLSSDQLADHLVNDRGYTIRERNFDRYSDLAHIRSVFMPEQKVLVVNERLTHDQRSFLLAKEIGYDHLGLSEQRALVTPWPKATSFDHVLNNSRASYFAGALLIPAAPLVEDLRHLFAESSFDPAAFLAIWEHAGGSPETFMLRLTNILPQHFGVVRMFFQRFDHQPAEQIVEPKKVLFLDRKQDPMSIELLNDTVGRWLKEQFFTTDATEAPRTMAARFGGENGSLYTVIALGRSRPHGTRGASALCIGMEVLPANEKLIGYLRDPALPRFALQPRSVVAERDGRYQRMHSALQGLLQELKAEG